MVMGMDIHINLIPTPGGPVPTPLPHIYVGTVLDPGDYIPYIGQTLKVNGFMAAQPMTEVLLTPQIFIAGPFQKPPEMKGEIVLGSNSVGTASASLTDMGAAGLSFAAEKLGFTPPPPPPPTPPTSIYPLSRLGSVALACADVGPPAKTSKDKTGGVKGLTFVAGVVMAIPKGKLVMAMGPPAPAPLSAFVLRFAMQFAIGKLLKMAKNLGKKLVTMLNHGVLKKLAKKSNKAKRVSDFLCRHGLEPIDLATGKMFTHRLDFTLPGAIPLEWDCRYSTASTYDGPSGYGWHHPYDLALTPELNEGYLVMKLRMADGRFVFFPQLATGERHLDVQEKLELFRFEDGYRLRDANRLWYDFDESQGDNWPLKCISDRSGNQVNFAYDDKGALKEINDSAGRVLPVRTDITGRILSIHAPHPELPGQNFPLVRYEYDKAGNLLSAKNALDHAYRYVYAGHLMTELIYRDGVTFYYEYDATDENARCTHSHGDDGLYNGNIVYEEGKTTLERIVGYPDGHVERFIETIYHDGAVALKDIDAKGNAKQFEYDENYLLLSETDEVGNRTQYAYDARGNLTQLDYPDGTQVKLNYDDDDNLLAATDQLGGKWAWVYNEKGQLTQKADCLKRVTKFGYNEAGQLNQYTDPAGGRTLIAYNEQGQLSQMTTPDNASYRMQYDRLGRNTEAIDPKGNAKAYRFDLLGQVTQVKEPDGNLREMDYDVAGNIIHYKDRQSDIRFRYAGLNEMVSRTENGTTVNFRYNTEEQLVGIENEHGSVYQFDLDANGLVELESGFDGVTRHYQRDAAGRVTRLTKASGLESFFAYDPMGRILERTHSNGAFERFFYREDGQLVEAHNQDGSVLLEKDELGRVVSDNQNGFSVHSTYNLLGLRDKLTTSLGLELGIDRDQMGDVLGMETKGASVPWSLRFKRNILGLEVERLFSSGVKGEWERDNLGRPTHHRVFSKGGELERSRGYEWGVDHRLKRFVDFGTEVTQFQHDAVGNLAGAIYPDGSTEHRRPDAVGNLFRKADRSDRKYGPAGQLLEAEGTRYHYDAEGFLVRKELPDGKDWTYQWDAAGMLSEVRRPDGESVRFTYDALGRRISKKFKGTTTYWVWDGNVPVHEWSTDQVEGENPSPPPPSEISPPPPPVNLDSDSDEIVFFEKGTAPEFELKDTITISPAETTSAAEPVPDTAAPPIRQIAVPNSQTLVSWLFEPESFAPIGKIAGNKTFSIQTDHLGTPISMYDEDGKRVWAGQLNIYGELSMTVGGAEQCPFRYPGQYEDVETGLYYNRFRYYDAGVGGYVSQDPIGLEGSNPTFYNYTKDVNIWIDPFGLNVIDLTNLSDIWGQSAEDIAKQFNDAGFETSVRQSTRGSGNARIVSIKGSSIAQVQVHSGGGRHGGSYYKISTDNGKIKIIDPKTYIHIEGEKIKAYFDMDGNKGEFDINGKWKPCS